MPVPEGTSAVQFRGENWGNGNNEWAARDISIWSELAPEIEERSADHQFFQSLLTGDRTPESYMCDIDAPRDKIALSN